MPDDHKSHGEASSPSQGGEAYSPPPINYRKMFQGLTEARRDAIWASMQASAKQAGERRYWCSVLFTKFCVMARSFQLLCPPTETDILGNWDFASVASLARNLFEGYLIFQYFSEPVEGEEWRARLNIMQLTDCKSRMGMFSQFGADAKSHQGFEVQFEDLKSRIEGNPYFQSLENNLQKQLLGGHRQTIFNTRELSVRAGIDGSVWGYFELLSSHTHTHPMSFYRSAEHGRTGVANEVDYYYIATAMDFVTDLLKRATEAFVKDFSDLVIFKSTRLGPDALLKLRQASVPLAQMNRSQRRAIERSKRR
jgi:hypothetical protein